MTVFEGLPSTNATPAKGGGAVAAAVAMVVVLLCWFEEGKVRGVFCFIGRKGERERGLHHPSVPSSKVWMPFTSQILRVVSHLAVLRQAETDIYLSTRLQTRNTFTSDFLLPTI